MSEDLGVERQYQIPDALWERIKDSPEKSLCR